MKNFGLPDDLIAAVTKAVTANPQPEEHMKNQEVIDEGTGKKYVPYTYRTPGLSPAHQHMFGWRTFPNRQPPSLYNRYVKTLKRRQARRNYGIPTRSGHTPGMHSVFHEDYEYLDEQFPVKDDKKIKSAKPDKEKKVIPDQEDDDDVNKDDDNDADDKGRDQFDKKKDKDSSKKQGFSKQDAGEKDNKGKKSKDKDDDKNEKLTKLSGDEDEIIIDPYEPGSDDDDTTDTSSDDMKLGPQRVFKESKGHSPLVHARIKQLRGFHPSALAVIHKTAIRKGDDTSKQAVEHLMKKHPGGYKLDEVTDKEFKKLDRQAFRDFKSNKNPEQPSKKFTQLLDKIKSKRGK